MRRPTKAERIKAEGQKQSATSAHGKPKASHDGHGSGVENAKANNRLSFNEPEQASSDNCPHCAMLAALRRFAHEKRDGEMGACEVAGAVAALLSDVIEQAPDKEARAHVEKTALDMLDYFGVHWIRVEGTA